MNRHIFFVLQYRSIHWFLFTAHWLTTVNGICSGFWISFLIPAKIRITLLHLINLNRKVYPLSSCTFLTVSYLHSSWFAEHHKVALIWIHSSLYSIWQIDYNIYMSNSSIHRKWEGQPQQQWLRRFWMVHGPKPIPASSEEPNDTTDSAEVPHTIDYKASKFSSCSKHLGDFNAWPESFHRLSPQLKNFVKLISGLTIFCKSQVKISDLKNVCSQNEKVPGTVEW